MTTLLCLSSALLPRLWLWLLTPVRAGSHGDTGGHGGMMSADELARLERARGAEFDRAFLEMMIRHHEGAVTMARTELSDGQFPAGSMGPKVDSALQFVKSSGQQVLITDVEVLREALEGKDGTLVVP